MQKQIADSHGSQCGFCTPGIVMSMYTLLRNKPRPEMEDIETYFQVGYYYNSLALHIYNKWADNNSSCYKFIFCFKGELVSMYWISSNIRGLQGLH